MQRATELVDDQRCERFAFDILGDDEQRLAHFCDLLEQREQILHGADFLFVDQDTDILEGAFHALGIGDEVRGKIAAVELHTFDHFERGFHRLGFLDGDHAILADLLHCFRDDGSDLLVVVGADRADLRDHVALHVFVEFLDFFDGDFNGLLDAALEGHGAGAGRDRLHAFAEDSLSQNSCRGGAVAGDVGSFRRDFADHLGAHVFERIGQLDFFRHGDAVLGDDRRAEFLFDDRVAPLGAQRDLDGVSQNVDAPENRLARILTSHNLLCHEN